MNNKEYQKQWNEKNKERIKAQKHQYYLDNKEHILNRTKTYQKNNKDKIKEQKQQYYIENKEHIDHRIQEYEENNKEKIKERKHNYYIDNKDKIDLRQENYEPRKQDLIEEQRQFINTLKEQACVACGQTFPPECMDFDHIDPTTKKFIISKAKGSLVSKEKLLAEIKKCELRCANCHRNKQKKTKVAYRGPGRQKKLDAINQRKIDSGCRCMDCDGIYDVWQLDFDHRDPNDKIMGVASMPNYTYTIEDIAKEMDKCDLVCANCHRIRTHNKIK